MSSTTTTLSGSSTTTEPEPASPTSRATPLAQPLWRRVPTAAGAAVLVTFGGGTGALAAANGDTTRTALIRVGDTDGTGGVAA